MTAYGIFHICFRKSDDGVVVVVEEECVFNWCSMFVCSMFESLEHIKKKALSKTNNGSTQHFAQANAVNLIQTNV